MSSHMLARFVSVHEKRSPGAQLFVRGCVVLFCLAWSLESSAQEAESKAEAERPAGVARGDLTGAGGTPVAAGAGTDSTVSAQADPAEPLAESAVPEADVASPGEGAASQPVEVEASPNEIATEPAAEATDVDPEPASIRLTPGRGIDLETDDGNFGINLSGRIQLLGELGLPGDPAEANDLSFSVRRARLKFKSHLFGSDTRLVMELAFSNRDRGVRNGTATYSPVLDYYLELRHLRDFNIRVGQFKIPFSRERVISSSRLQMVDRSIVNKELTIDRDTGLTVSSRDLGGLGMLRYHAGVFLGEGRDYPPGNGARQHWVPLHGPT